MRKKYYIVIVCLVISLILLGSIMAIYMNKKENVKDDKFVLNEELVKIEEENILKNTIQTSANQEKISPNSILIEKQYFKGCDHIIKNVKDMPEQFINLTRQELEEKISNKWKIEKFSKEEIVIYKEEEGFCKQHYLIKENNGVLGIYMIDEDGKITLKENTEIQTQYLTQIDLKRVKQGIEAVGDMELYTILEDFE